MDATVAWCVVVYLVVAMIVVWWMNMHSRGGHDCRVVDEFASRRLGSGHKRRVVDVKEYQGYRVLAEKVEGWTRTGQITRVVDFHFIHYLANLTTAEQFTMYFRPLYL